MLTAAALVPVDGVLATFAGVYRSSLGAAVAIVATWAWVAGVRTGWRLAPCIQLTMVIATLLLDVTANWRYGEVPVNRTLLAPMPRPGASMGPQCLR